MVGSALLHLHGFSMTDAHPQGCQYVHSGEDIAAAFDRWRSDCARFDANPAEFMQERRAAIRAYLDEEKRKQS
ncbi:hypothetical protein ACWCP6_05935 [Streptomyces sp. NPDC002004]